MSLKQRRSKDTKKNKNSRVRNRTYDDWVNYLNGRIAKRLRIEYGELRPDNKFNLPIEIDLESIPHDVWEYAQIDLEDLRDYLIPSIYAERINEVYLKLVESCYRDFVVNHADYHAVMVTFRFQKLKPIDRILDSLYAVTVPVVKINELLEKSKIEIIGDEAEVTEFKNQALTDVYIAK